MENNNLEKETVIESNTTIPDPPKPEPKADFDINNFNSYAQNNTPATNPPTVSATELPNTILNPDGSYYTPPPPTDAAYYHQNGGMYTPIFEQPPIDPALEARNFKKAARRRFSYVALAIIAMYFIYTLAGTLALGIYSAVTGIDEPSQTVQMIVSTLSVALAGFPTLFLILLPKKATKIPKTKIKLPKMIAYFTMTYLAMYTGVIINSVLKTVLSEILGADIKDIVSSSLDGVPTWLIVIFVCIFPGIFEELTFRKLIIDKTREFGDFGAIVFSALTFGMFHGNFEQFFYAFLTGLLFGYIYVRSGRIIYTIILHAMINFFGSVVASQIEDSTLAIGIYLLAIFIICAIGVIALIFEIIDNHKKFKNDIGIKTIGGTDVVLSTFLNPGGIAFLIFFAFIFVLMTLATYNL